MFRNVCWRRRRRLTKSDPSTVCCAPRINKSSAPTEWAVLVVCVCEWIPTLSHITRGRIASALLLCNKFLPLQDAEVAEDNFEKTDAELHLKCTPENVPLHIESHTTNSLVVSANLNIYLRRVDGNSIFGWLNLQSIRPKIYLGWFRKRSELRGHWFVCFTFKVICYPSQKSLGRIH